jgi:hypothetical protein
VHVESKEVPEVHECLTPPHDAQKTLCGMHLCMLSLLHRTQTSSGSGSGSSRSSAGASSSSSSSSGSQSKAAPKNPQKTRDEEVEDELAALKRKLGKL